MTGDRGTEIPFLQASDLRNMTMPSACSLVLQHLRQKMHLELSCSSMDTMPFLAHHGTAACKTNAGLSDFILLPHEKPLDLRAKHRFIWLCADDVLQAEGSKTWQWLDVWSLGAVFVVEDVNQKERMFSVFPRPPESQTTLFHCQLLYPANEYVSLHSALKNICEHITLDSEKRLSAWLDADPNATSDTQWTSSALRAWFGMVPARPSFVVNSVFGAPGKRSWIQGAAAALGLRKGFSKRQTDILTNFNSVLPVIRSIFGGGKTQLLLALAWQCLRALASTVKIIFAAPSMSVARQFADQLRKIARLEAGEVVILGTDRSHEGRGLEQQCREELIAEHMQPWACFFSVLDDMANIVVGKLLDVSSSTGFPEFVMQRLLRILSLRRQLIVSHMYPLVNKNQSALLERLRVISLTNTQATKAAAGLTSFTTCLKAKSFLVTLFDDYVEKGWEQLVGAMTEADVAFMVGDMHAGRPRTPYPVQNRYEQGLVNVAPNWKALQMAPAWTWAEKNGTVYALMETHRVGYPAFNFLYRAFPQKLKGVRSLAEGSTCIVPLLDQDLGDSWWDLNERGQPIWSFNIFWQFLFFVSLEVIVSYRKNWEHTIAIYGFSRSYLVPFGDLLHRELSNVVASMCTALHIELSVNQNEVSFASLCDRGVIYMRGPENLQGIDVDVSFAFCYRQGDEWGGHMHEQRFPYMHLSRASRRLYLGLQDKRSTIKFPESHLQVFTAAGVPRKNLRTPAELLSSAKRRDMNLFWCEVCRHLVDYSSDFHDIEDLTQLRSPTQLNQTLCEAFSQQFTADLKLSPEVVFVNEVTALSRIA